MKLERWSWIAAIVAIPLAICVWLIDRNDFIKFCESCWGTIFTPFTNSLRWLAHPVTWPVWGIILLGVSGFASAIAAFFFFLWRASKEAPHTPESPTTSYQDYRSDEIFGVRWIWVYVYGKLTDDSLTAYCPRKDCMRRLEAKINRLAHANVNLVGFPVSLFCPRCGFQHDFNFSEEHLKREVTLEIERLVNTGEFLHRLTKNEQARSAC